MVTVKYAIVCDLCGQPVEIEGFSMMVGQKKLAFCCAGCLSIYQLIYMDNPSGEAKNKTNENEEKE